MNSQAPNQSPKMKSRNPFATLSRFKDGRKILASSSDAMPYPSDVQPDPLTPPTTPVNNGKYTPRYQSPLSYSFPCAPRLLTRALSSMEIRSSQELRDDYVKFSQSHLNMNWGNLTPKNTPPVSQKSATPPLVVAGCKLKPAHSSLVVDTDASPASEYRCRRPFSPAARLRRAASHSLRNLVDDSGDLYPGLRRYGSCESGFHSFSDSTAPDLSPDLGALSVDDSTLSSYRSIETDDEFYHIPRKWHFFPNHQRSSSVYTDSSEDISSLGELTAEDRWWFERNRKVEHYDKDVREMVEYFEKMYGKHEGELCARKVMARTKMDDKPVLRRFPIESVIRKDREKTVEDIRQSYSWLRRRQGLRNYQSKIFESNYKEECSGVLKSAKSVFRPHEPLVVCKGTVQSKLKIFNSQTNDNTVTTNTISVATSSVLPNHR